MAYRVVHYLNQFFGGIGGEDKATEPVQVREGPVGPGRALQMALKDAGIVVATVICGDDYVAENEHVAGLAIEKALQKHRPDLVIAGPAFDSGRYGLGCALICRIAQSKGIPAVTGMDPDNAAVITHRRELLAVPTSHNVADMQAALAKMAALGLKLARGEELGSADEEGYVPRGIRKLVFKDRVGYERALDMLLARVKGEPWKSEIAVQRYETVPPAPAIEDLSKATIGIVVSTGIVPKGNPDRIPGARALHAGRYLLKGVESLSVEEYESVHGGFNTRILNTRNPNYALPLPSLRELERQGIIKAVYPYFYATVGNQTAVGPAREIGQHIAQEFKEAGVDAVLEVAG
ncbi:MAG: glycine/betaine/sarcosine/D-proline family reductase selenoprotein B [Chloroflexi bacterium]|nr:glycine/betaine/sarcosine/D-proline family reductase selenoprotein B [Chloroflexota bacterium]